MKYTSSTSRKQLKYSVPTSTISALQKELRKKHPKTWAKLDKRWETKMATPVFICVMSIFDNVNPRLRKLAKKDEYVINAEEIEEKVWELLKKARRLA